MVKKLSSDEIMTFRSEISQKYVTFLVTTCHALNQLCMFTALKNLATFEVLFKQTYYVST